MRRVKRKKLTDGLELRIIALEEMGMNSVAIASELGISGQAVRHAIQRERIRQAAEPFIDLEKLSLSAKKKAEAAIRQHQRKINLEFEKRVLQEIQRRINMTVLPSLLKREAEASRIVKGRKGSMSKEEYRLMLSCLHPDRVSEELKKKYEAAFHIFKGLEKLLLDEKELPTNVVQLPTTYADLMARRKIRAGGAKIRVK